MIRRIVQLGEPVLKARARALGADDLAGDAVRLLARDMFETLEQSGGVGLAAPQVGESVRLILAGSFPSARDPERPEVTVMALVNPRIAWASDETESGWEGCLSFRDYRVRVVRARAIRVEYLTLDGAEARIEASGFYARVLQHEIDHLDGILTLDRAEDAADIERMDDSPS
jgi:peptide deformylase